MLILPPEKSLKLPIHYSTPSIINTTITVTGPESLPHWDCRPVFSITPAICLAKSPIPIIRKSITVIKTICSPGITDQLGNQYKYTYNDCNLLASLEFPPGKFRTYLYDPNQKMPVRPISWVTPLPLHMTPMVIRSKNNIRVGESLLYL